MYTYQNFKEDLVNRSYGWLKPVYTRVVDFVKLNHSEEEIQVFYLKNGMNSKENTELYFSFPDGLLKATELEGGQLLYEFYEGRPIKKELITSKFNQQTHRLTITFEEGYEFVFDNIEDSNSDWSEEYTESIFQLYKFL